MRPRPFVSANREGFKLAIMQTRSKTRKALTRSLSCDSHPRLEVLSEEHAIVDHVDDDDTNMTLVPVNPPTVQQDLINIVQAQVYAQAATQHNNEVRLQQAFAATEARLQATAHAIVQGHVAEQAIETRRDLEQGIQKALIDAYTQAHQQAMTTAQERLNAFITEIHEKIQAQLTQAVNTVDTKGVAYLNPFVDKRVKFTPSGRFTK